MKIKTEFNFVSKFPIAVILSTVMVLSSFLVLFQLGLNYGVDFRGGAEIQVRFEKALELETLRAGLTDGGVQTFSVQSIGGAGQNEFLIKAGGSDLDINKITESIEQLIQTKFQEQAPDIRRTDIVGPKAGARLRNSGFQAMAWAIIGIMIYLGLRFDFKYAPGAVIALIHDVIIVVGIFALSGKEFSLQIVGALLAIIGYSVNDTVVVYDRVREVESTSDSSLSKVINKALNDTLTRTTLTSLTTLFVSGTMFVMGGGAIQDFFFAFSLGVIIGTYSSIFIAAPVTLFFDRFTHKTKVA